jgi:uncharacterized membrane protein
MDEGPHSPAATADDLISDGENGDAGSESVVRDKPVTRAFGRVSAVVARWRVENVYLVVALVWGLLMVVALPPFQVPDEPGHFFRIWSLATGQLAPPKDAMATVPANVADLTTRLGSAVWEWDGNTYSLRRTIKLLGQKNGDRTVKAFANTYGPLGYLPQIAAVRTVILLGRSPLAGFYLARVLNLLTAILLTYFAIRLMPFAKVTWALIGLLPMAVAEMASLSPDALAIGGMLLFVAMVCRCLSAQSLGRWQVVGLLAASLILLNFKTGYGVASLVFFALPVAAYGSRRRWAAWSTALVAVNVGVLLLAMRLQAISQTALDYWMKGPSSIHPDEQMSWVLHHPWGFAKVVIAAFDHQLFELAKELAGVLGWVTLRPPELILPEIMLAGALVVLLFSLSWGSEPRLRWSQRGLFAVAAIAVTAGICLALYTGFSIVRSGVILGLQGRYFIPCLPLAAVALYRLPRPGRSATIVILLIVGIACALITLAKVVQYFY